MNLLIQLKQPLLDGDGTPKAQLAAECVVDEDSIVINTIFGVVVVRREDITAAIILADDYNREALQDRGHILVLN